MYRLIPAKLFGIAAPKIFGLAAVGMAVGTAEAILNPTPLQSWATIAGAIATSLASLAALAQAHKHSRSNRGRKPGAITHRKPTKQ